MRTVLYITEFIPPDAPSPIELLEPRLQDSYRPALADAIEQWNLANPFDQAGCGQYQREVAKWHPTYQEGNTVVIHVIASDECHAWIRSLLPDESYDLGAPNPDSEVTTMLGLG